MTLKNLTILPEDQERLNLLLGEIGDIISRNNSQGLELDFDYWSKTVFGPITNYGDDCSLEIEVPQAFTEAFD